MGSVKKTGNEAVETYRSIVRSDVDEVNDDHTQAIQDRIGTALKEFAAEEDMTIAAGDITSLSAGVTELIWKSVLNQIEVVTENVEESEYFYLAESLQQQIKELDERKTKLSIRANINNKADLSAEELLKLVNGMTDRELEEFAKSLGISLDDLKEEMQKDILKEVETKYGGKTQGGNNGSNGANGKDGKDGNDGKAGKDGKDGENGKDGEDGKSTYIAYADDRYGAGFSLTPTETTKYVGSCITTNSTQPTDPREYSNWQEYRAYIITVTTDENDVTTVHIN